MKNYCYQISFTPMQGSFDFKNRFQLTSEVKEQTEIMAPKAITAFPQGSEATAIPILPITMDRVFIKEEADPVSPFCCSKSKFVLNGLITVPHNDINTKEIQNSIGARVPIVITRIPLIVDTPNIIVAKTFLFIFLNTFT